MNDNGNHPVVGSVTFSPQVNLLIERYFPLAFAEISKLMEHGATTHPHDLEWRDHNVEIHQLHLEEHLWQYLAGHQVDPESKQSQLVHVAARAIMMLEVELRNGN